jgi:hypothetical protein
LHLCESPDGFDIAPLPGRNGIEIHDLVEDARVELYSGRAVDPTPTSTEPFLFPVTTAVEFETSEIGFIGLWIEDCPKYHLTGRFSDTVTVSPERLAEFVERTESTPVILDGEFSILEADSFSPEA